ncbi:Uncharacterized [Moorella glycerini]|uniref:Uncharacterized protein n=1 Tax=Neomoorella stamsii TaxID=1266720 RepID=A0A9X7P548_9FIRM|nr:hypothetical protein [Moorella glycerini]PRR69634.1 hypothetical protein MOST_30560 [Moorella stamsii]CEP67842.1 Uncharacterized [Moorella glycerini]
METIIYCDCQECIYLREGECQRVAIKITEEGICLVREHMRHYDLQAG